jgi:hypothetical protein
MKAAMQDLALFTKAVKTRLSFRLGAVSLSLVDVGLQRGESKVETPGPDSFRLVGWVNRPATGQVHEFALPFRADIEPETDVEAIDPICEKIVQACVGAFYGAKGEA